MLVPIHIIFTLHKIVNYTRVFVNNSCNIRKNCKYFKIIKYIENSKALCLYLSNSSFTVTLNSLPASIMSSKKIIPFLLYEKETTIFSLMFYYYRIPR